jgi:NADPH2:quinone reductase
VPAGIDSKIAVAVMNQGQTAHYLVHDAYEVQPGDRVLIHAGAGCRQPDPDGEEAGRLRLRRCRVKKADFVRDLGADEVILYTEVDFVDGSKRTNGEGVRVVYTRSAATTWRRASSAPR